MSGSFWPTTSVSLVIALRCPDDQPAWERFSAEYRPVILAYCERHGLQEADAEDVVQSVFVGVNRRIGFLDYSTDIGRFRSWLSTIALRVIWKLRQPHGACELRDPSELAKEPAAPDRLMDEINESVLQLAMDEVRPEFDAETWGTFNAVWFNGERPQAVAARIHRPVTWVYKAKFHVLRRLKDVVVRISRELDQF